MHIHIPKCAPIVANLFHRFCDALMKNGVVICEFTASKCIFAYFFLIIEHIYTLLLFFFWKKKFTFTLFIIFIFFHKVSFVIWEKYFFLFSHFLSNQTIEEKSFTFISSHFHLNQTTNKFSHFSLSFKCSFLLLFTLFLSFLLFFI